MEQVPAAQYVRMSTEHQQFSIENQTRAIQEYAEKHGYSIVRTYTDAARSGVVIKNRKGLVQLIQDVVSGDVNYSAILVYDVSRWGRFQNADESAHYEFLCTSSGIPVHYCAEQFSNDGSIQNMLMKALRRTMAGEFSRDLGNRVYAGQKRLVEHGFKMGGTAPYGLRRQLISCDGVPKQILLPGQYKSISSDRVIIVPGPPEELEVIRRIFMDVVERKMRPLKISNELRRQGIPYMQGKKWNRFAVDHILNDPKYAGCNVWGRTSVRLHSRTQSTPKEKWITKEGAFQSIVSLETFNRARKILKDRTINKTNEEILDRMREVLKIEGHLSQRIIEDSRILPSYSAISRRFGTLSNAYELIGYKLSRRFFGRCFRRKETQQLRADFIKKLLNIFPSARIVRKQRNHRAMISFAKDVTLSVDLCPYKPSKAGTPRWRLEIVPRERNNIALLCFLNKANDKIARCYLMPGISHKQECIIHLNDPWLRTGIRIYDLQYTERMARKLLWRMNEGLYDPRDWHQTSRYFLYLDDPHG